MVNSPIMAANVSATLGLIGGILLDSHLCRIAAFILNQSPDNSLSVLPWMGIKRLESGRAIAWSPSMVVKAREMFDIRRLLSQGTIQRGTRFHSADDKFLGTMTDFWFDEHSGKVNRYEVSNGPFFDVHTGSGFVPAVAETRFEKDTNIAYVPLDYQELVDLINTLF